MTTKFIDIRSSLLELFLSLQLIFYLKCVRCEGRILTLLRLNLHDCVNFHHQNRNISAFFAHFICHYCTSQSGINQPFSVIPECLPHLRMMTPPLRPTLRGGKRILSKGAMATESRGEIKPPHIPSAGLQEELQRPSDRPAGSNTGSENHRRSIERTFHLLWPPTREFLPAIKPGR